ncbi:MAG: zinc-ribbon domain-containing protein [Tepidisphaeraceae bacterium]
MFLLVVLLVVGWALFFAWVIGQICRVLWLGVSRMTGLGSRSHAAQLGTLPCSRFRCGATNPPQANFCRRCGSPLLRPAPQRQTGRPADSERWASRPISL